MNRITLSPDHWTALIDALRNGVIRRLRCSCVDLSTLAADAFLAVVGCRGIPSIVIERSIIRSGLITDELIRASAAKGMRTLAFSNTKSDAPHRFTEEAELDFVFRADAAAGRLRLSLTPCSVVTDTFLVKFFERLKTSPILSAGSLKLYGAPKQRGLSTFARYLSPVKGPWADAMYIFPSVDDDKESSEVEFHEHSSSLDMFFSPVYCW